MILFVNDERLDTELALREWEETQEWVKDQLLGRITRHPTQRERLYELKDGRYLVVTRYRNADGTYEYGGSFLSNRQAAAWLDLNRQTAPGILHQQMLQLEPAYAD